MARIVTSLRTMMIAGVAGVAALGAIGSMAAFVGEAHAKTVVIKHTNIYVATLPTGCVKTMYGNVVVWRCGKIYYQPYKGRYVRVYIN